MMRRERFYRRTLLIVAGVAVSAALVAGCGDGTTSTTGNEGTQPAGESVVIGAVVSATGPASALGVQERNVLEMMGGYINGAGGVLGRDVKIVVIDDQSDPKQAVTATNQLIDQEGAVAIIAGTSSSAAEAVKAITAEAKIPQIALAAGNNVTDVPPIDWIWRTPQKDADVVARALTYVSDILGVTKIAVLHDENAFGSSGATEIVDTAADHGLEVVANESYKTDETDMTAQLTKIKGDNPEALIVWGTNPGPALVAKNMQQLAMDIPYIGSHGIAFLRFIELAGDAAEGVVFPAGALLIPSSITNAEQKKVVDAFVETYEYEWGEAPNPFAGYAYAAITLLVDAMTRAGSTEAVAIQAALNATTGFAGPDGIYNYSETNHDGLTSNDLIMVKIEGGAWVLAE